MKAKTKFTKLWSILLALAMVVGMLPIAALAAGSATVTADFSTDPITALALLNDAKTGTTDSTWDNDTKTLTLNGVNFETTAATAVKLPDGAIIVLNGENTIKGGSGSGDCYGIYGVGSLTISGIGTLNVTSGTAGNLSFGIHAQNSVTIDGGAVTATGGAAPNNQSFGIRALYNDLTINGGTVTATGVDAKNSSNGLWAGNGSVTISGGKVVANGGGASSGTSSGIYAKNVVIQNTDNRIPHVTTRGGNGVRSRGIYANGGNLEISGGVVIAKAGYSDSAFALNKAPTLPTTPYWWRTSDSGDYSKSAYTGDGSAAHLEIWNWDPTATADFTDDSEAALARLNAAKTGAADSTWDPDTKTLTLNGVNFTATAATAVKLPANTTIVLANGTTNTITGGDSDSSTCFGIFGVGSLIIQGTGTLNVTAGDAENNISYGIYAGEKVTISGTADVTAEGGEGGSSFGIWAEYDATISGTVTAEGGTATDQCSVGIYANYEMTISGGEVKATGGTVSVSMSTGAYSYGINGKIVTISDGTVEATGGTASGTGASDPGNDILSYGIGGSGVSISGGTVIAKGGTATDLASNANYGNSYGICTGSRHLSISGTAEVTATSGTATSKSYGIFADDGNMTISGGAVKAKAGSASGIAAALNKQPTLPITAYSWRLSDSEEYREPDYNWKDYPPFHTYVEIKSNPTVTFDVNGANAAVAPASGTTNAAGKLTSLPEPIRSGYTFKEWNTKQDGSGTTVTDETTFTENTTVYAQWEVATVTIPSVAITGVDAPKSNTAFDTTAVCESAGVSNTEPTVTWDSEDDKAGYGKIYTASITLTASEGYVFADSTTVTVNGNPATSVTKNANGTLTVTYEFPATDKHNIEITVDTDVHDGDAVKNPTINSGYEVPICFFVEDTNKNGDFTDDKTLLLDKALVEEFIARPEIDMTLEEFIAALKDEGLDDVKTEYTGGYDYSFIAMVVHNEEVSFDDDEDGKVTDAIVKVNGKDVTDKCDGGSSLTVNPSAYVFSAAKTYTVSFDANGGTGSMADVTGVLGDYTLPANGFTAPEGKQFKSWSVDGKEKAVGDKITVTADTTVKAVWETLPAAPTEYDILNGANSKWTQDSDGNISVRGSGEFSKFVGVKVDGKTVDEKYYTVKEGSTIVTLKPEYLNTLTAGKHTLKIVWTDGTADTTFTVDAKPANTDTKSPQTGDSSSIALWIAMLFVSAAGVLSTAVLGKKKKRSAK